MISDLARLIEAVHREKNLPRDVVVEVVESAMEAADSLVVASNARKFA